MGVLTIGHPLAWEDSLKHLNYIKVHGVLQFIECWRKHRDDDRAHFRWGDEVEYNIVRMYEDIRKAVLSCRAPELLPQLVACSKAISPGTKKGVDWKPEYANWMIEGTPGQPYNDSTSDLILVEKNLRLRRRCITELLYSDELVMMIPAFPRMGCGIFTSPEYTPSPHGNISQSIYIPDEVIQPHPRFPTLTANIRKRRGRKVAIRVPLFKDLNTDASLHLESIPSADSAAAAAAASVEASWPIGSDGKEVREEIYMDSMGFGMGCCCLQVTMQARNLDEARELYDQLAVLAPFMMALSAATPILKGLLADTDVRWDLIAASVDCRNDAERGVEVDESKKTLRIERSRYDNIECYISRSPLLLDEYNDVHMLVDQSAVDTMLGAGIDERLARHIAHLFIRDPLVLFEEKIYNVDDITERDHFENLQSTNWNTVRFKPPPAFEDIGWRVEFRSMDLALTEFENAMHSVFVILLSRAILSFHLNLYIPMSSVEQNMRRAHHRDAVLTQRFLFRKNIFSAEKAEVVEMTLDEIFNGTTDYPGLIPVVRKYLSAIECPQEHLTKIEGYLSLLSQRASGAVQTAAKYMRNFVLNHHEYQKDSRVSDVICYDLLAHIDAVARGEIGAPELLGSAEIPHEPLPARKDRSRANSEEGPQTCACIDDILSPQDDGPLLLDKRLRGASLVLDPLTAEELQRENEKTK